MCLQCEDISRPLMRTDLNFLTSSAEAGRLPGMRDVELDTIWAEPRSVTWRTENSRQGDIGLEGAGITVLLNILMHMPLRYLRR